MDKGHHQGGTVDSRAGEAAEGRLPGHVEAENHPSGVSGETARPAALSASAKVLLPALVYLVVAEVGPWFLLGLASIMPVWTAPGIALVLVFLWGIQVLPGIALGVFVHSVLALGGAGASHGVAILGAVGMTLGAAAEIAAGYGLYRWRHTPAQLLRTLGSVRRFVGAIVLAGPALGATVMTATLCACGALAWEQFGGQWVDYWSASAIRVLLVVPVAMAWFRTPLPEAYREAVYTAAMVVFTLLLGWMVFRQPWSPTGHTSYPLEYLVLPFVPWLAVRFGARTTTLAVLLVALMAARYTADGFGPFAMGTPSAAMRLMVMYQAVLAGFAWLFLAAINERRETQETLDRMHREFRRKTEDDLASRRRIERELRTALDRLNHLLTSSTAVIYTSAPEPPYAPTFVSGNVASVLGFPAAGFLAHPDFWRGHVYQSDLPDMEAEARRLFETGRSVSEYRFRRPNGSAVWVRDEKRLLYDNDGAPYEIVGSWLDITVEKEAEKALRKSESRYRSILENVEEGYFEVDLSGNFLFLNDSLCRILNTSETVLRAGTAWRFLPRQEARKARGLFKRVYETGEGVARAQFQLQRRDGIKAIVETSVYLTRDEAGKPKGFHGVCRDFTAQIRADLEAQRRREELAHISRVAAMGELAGTLAHEINQPLAAMRSSAQAAQRFLAAAAPDLDEVRDALQDIVDANRRGSEVIRRMRAFLRKGGDAFRELDLRDTAGEVLALVEREAAARGIEVRMARPEHPAWVRGDPTQLQQVLLNLVLNSLEAMRGVSAENKYLDIRVEAGSDNHVEVTVRDYGAGVPPETAARMFEPFFSTRENGLGVGLSISRNIVEAHGGSLWHEAPQGPGAIFGFRIHARRP